MEHLVYREMYSCRHFCRGHHVPNSECILAGKTVDMEVELVEGNDIGRETTDVLVQVTNGKWVAEAMAQPRSVVTLKAMVEGRAGEAESEEKGTALGGMMETESIRVGIEEES